MQTAEVGVQDYRPNNAEKCLENTEGKNITRLLSCDRPVIKVYKGANQ